MTRTSITFVLDARTGEPRVETCRGDIRFISIKDAADFVAARAHAHLKAHSDIWASFEEDVAKFSGERSQGSRPNNDILF